MKTLRAMLQDVLVGEQRVVLISGEAGVGQIEIGRRTAGRCSGL